MSTKKTTTKTTKYVFAQPGCTFTLGGKTYVHGDAVDDWTDEQREQFRFYIAPVADK